MFIVYVRELEGIESRAKYYQSLEQTLGHWPDLTREAFSAARVFRGDCYRIVVHPKRAAFSFDEKAALSTLINLCMFIQWVAHTW